jgi:hypothetical protein
MGMIAPPNGMPISRCERITQTAKKRTISGAKRSAAWACSALRLPAFWLPPACVDHTGTESRRQNGRSSEPRPSGITLGTTGLEPNHAHLGSGCLGRAFSTTSFRTTLCTTGFQHNEPSYHTLHNEHRHAGAGTTGVQEARFVAITSIRECRSPSPDAERIAHQLPPRRAA